jgi:hypothetical protein
MIIVAMRTIAIMIKAVIIKIPRIGSSSEDSGRYSGMRSRNTIIVNKIVVTKPIRSPLSVGMTKLMRVKAASMIAGGVR